MEAELTGWSHMWWILRAIGCSGRRTLSHFRHVAGASIDIVPEPHHPPPLPPPPLPPPPPPPHCRFLQAGLEYQNFSLDCKLRQRNPSLGMRTLRLPPPAGGGGGGGGIHRAALCVFRRFLGTTVRATRLQEVEVSVPIFFFFFFSQRVSLLTGNKESKTP